MGVFEWKSRTCQSRPGSIIGLIALSIGFILIYIGSKRTPPGDILQPCPGFQRILLNPETTRHNYVIIVYNKQFRVFSAP